MSKRKKLSRLAVDAAVYTIPEFCAAYRISEGMYFKLQAQGRGPRTIKIGRRKLIRIDDARAWALMRVQE